MRLDALARVPGDDRTVIVLGTTDMVRALCLHRDGSLSTVPVERITYNNVETAVRFAELEKDNLYLVENTVREH